MPFKSKAQAAFFFSGAGGPELKAKAHEWAAATPDMKKLPEKVKTHTFKKAKSG